MDKRVVYKKAQAASEKNMDKRVVYKKAQASSFGPPKPEVVPVGFGQPVRSSAVDLVPHTAAHKDNIPRAAAHKDNIPRAAAHKDNVPRPSAWVDSTPKPIAAPYNMFEKYDPEYEIIDDEVAVVASSRGKNNKKNKKQKS